MPSVSAPGKIHIGSASISRPKQSAKAVMSVRHRYRALAQPVSSRDNMRMRRSLRTAVAVLLIGLAGVFAHAAPAEGPAAQWPPKESLHGSFLVAPPDHDGGPFGRSVVFLLHHGESGATGVIVNKKLAQATLKSLLDGVLNRTGRSADSIPDLDVPVRYGGPVEPGAAIVVHSPEFAVEGTRKIGKLAAVSPMPEVLGALAEGRGPQRYAFFSGYAGWASAQLEAEIERKWWIVVPVDADILFDGADSTKWQRALDLRPVDL